MIFKLMGGWTFNDLPGNAIHGNLWFHTASAVCALNFYYFYRLQP